MGLSGVKKLDFRLRIAGEGGIKAKLSMVRSDREGLENLRNIGSAGASPFGERPLQVSWEDARESVLKLLMEASSSSFTTPFVLDIEARCAFGGKRERGLGTGFLKCPSWLVEEAVENARV